MSWFVLLDDDSDLIRVREPYHYSGLTEVYKGITIEIDYGEETEEGEYGPTFFLTKDGLTFVSLYMYIDDSKEETMVRAKKFIDKYDNTRVVQDGEGNV